MNGVSYQGRYLSLCCKLLSIASQLHGSGVIQKLELGFKVKLRGSYTLILQPSHDSSFPGAPLPGSNDKFSEAELVIQCTAPWLPLGSLLHLVPWTLLQNPLL